MQETSDPSSDLAAIATTAVRRSTRATRGRKAPPLALQTVIEEEDEQLTQAERATAADVLQAPVLAEQEEQDQLGNSGAAVGAHSKASPNYHVVCDVTQRSVLHVGLSCVARQLRLPSEVVPFRSNQRGPNSRCVSREEQSKSEGWHWNMPVRAVKMWWGWACWWACWVNNRVHHLIWMPNVRGHQEHLGVTIRVC